MDLNSSIQELSSSFLNEDPDSTNPFEPDFKAYFFSHILHKPKLIQKLKDFCLSHPNNGHLIFLLGLIYEYGLLEEQDPNKAKALYMKAANEFGNSHACYRLHFAYRQERKEQQKLQTLGITPDKEIAYWYLIRAGAYCNEMDNRISFKLVDPIMHLYFYCERQDAEHIRAFQIFSKMKNVHSPLFEPNYEYLIAWFQVKYPQNDMDKRDAKLVMKELAEKGHPEACCYMGESYRFMGDDSEEDIQQAAKYFETAERTGLLRAKEALIFIYLDMREIEKSLRFVYEAASEGSSVGMKFLGEFYLLDDYLPYDERKGLAHLKIAYLLSDYWALFSICIYMREKLKKESDIIPKKQGEAEEDPESSLEKRKTWSKKVFEYSEILYRCRDFIGPIVHSTIRYGSIAECFEKGIHVEKDITRALKYYEDFLVSHPREKKLAYIYYRMGVLYHKMEQHSKALELFSKAFKARTQFIKSDLRKESLHYYNYAKMLEKGLGVKANKELAKIYYKKGIQEAPITFFTKLYFYKCKRRLEELSKIENKPFKILAYQNTINKSLQEKESFKLKLIEPQDIMLVSERKMVGQPDIETLEGIYGSLENLSIPLKLSRVVKIKDIAFKDYMEVTARLWRVFADLKMMGKTDGVRVEEVYGVVLNRKEMSQLIVGKGASNSTTQTEESKKGGEEDANYVVERYINFVEFVYEKGWAYNVLCLDSIRYENNKRGIIFDFLPIIVNLYNEIKGVKKPKIKDSILSLLVYLKERKHMESSSVWKHEQEEKDSLEEIKICLNGDPFKNFADKLKEYQEGPKENILALINELELSEEIQERILWYIVF